MSEDTTPYAYSLFQQPWWLDAVAPGDWDVVEVKQNGQTVGRLPFVQKRRFGLTALGQTQLTKFLGPWIKTPEGKLASRLSREHEILSELMSSLPSHDMFNQNFHPELTNCLALHWSGYSESVGYTYVIEDLSDIDKVWSNLSRRARTSIRKAEKEIVIRTTDDIDTFISLLNTTYARQGLPPPYSEKFLRHMDEACAARDARVIMLAEGQDGQPHAAEYFVWDSSGAYGLMSGCNALGRKSGAVSLVVWEVMKYASQVTGRYDFCGSMIESVEQFNRSFGSQQMRFAQVSRGATLKGRLAQQTRRLQTSRLFSAASKAE